MTPHLTCALILSMSMISAALAQEPAPAVEAQADPAPAFDPPTRTGKERLGAKWTDEQRLDNCGVPPERRGPKPRPVDCDAGHRD